MYLNTQKINFASPKLYIDSTSSKSLFETCFTQEMSDNIFQRRFLREMLKCLEQSYATSCYDLFFSFLPFFARQNDRHTFTKEKERNDINLSNVALQKDG